MLGERKSFTLIELLVVLAIVAILSVAVILTLNPAELLKQARDSNRISDLNTLNTALGVYNADVVGGFVGTSTVVYVSVPDSSATCANLGLPTLPTGYTYKCSTTANYKKTDGTGWIPVNFSQATFGSPLSILPVDPINATSSGNYYTYASGGSFRVSSKIESQKYSGEAAKSNSYDPSLYVVGDNKNLMPFVGGLVGWWTFEDDNQSTTTDSSGWARNATWAGTSTDHYVAGKVGSYAAYFNGTSDYINYGDYNTMQGSNYEQSYSFWNLPTGSSNNMAMETSQRGVYSTTNAVTYAAIGVSNSSYSRSNSGAWEHVVITSSGTGGSGTLKIYVNGSLVKTDALGRGNAGGGPYIGSYSGVQYFFSGYLDDVRVYNRVLTAAEVQAIYSSY